MTSAYVKCGATFIGEHEDGVSDEENYNLPCWPLEEYGFSCASLQSTLHELFLHYKIERRVLPTESDTKHALLTVADAPDDLARFDIEITDEKLAYISQHSGGGFQASGLHTMTREQVIEVIRERITHNYVYNLRFKEFEGGTSGQFNLMLELPSPKLGHAPIRIQVGLEYQPQKLKVTTLY